MRNLLLPSTMLFVIIVVMSACMQMDQGFHPIPFALESKSLSSQSPLGDGSGSGSGGGSGSGSGSGSGGGFPVTKLPPGDPLPFPDASTMFVPQTPRVAHLTLSGNFSGIFGRVLPGTVVKKLVTIKNSGSTSASALTYSLSNEAFQFTGGSAPGAGGNCGPNLPSGAECQLEIAFRAPSPTGTLSEKLIINYTDHSVEGSSIDRQFTLGLYGAARTGEEIRKVYKAQLDYDIVYIRCPRGQKNIPINIKNNTEGNWGGINDMWIDASNNIHQQPGCSLVLHRSHPTPSDPEPEKVLVPCQSTDATKPQCTVFDPNVSLDGRYIVYAKTLDTRSFADPDFKLYPGYQYFDHQQSSYSFTGDLATRQANSMDPYAQPTYIFEYDLVEGTERQVSKPGQVHGERANIDFTRTLNNPIMDTGPIYLPDNEIAFTSNRENGLTQFQMFRMNRNGENIRLLGSRAISQQLHPFVLKDGRIIYTSLDMGFGKSNNNNYSLFQQYPDGSFPFIFAGKLDPSMITYHYATQLSDGDVVSAVYYNHNNMGTGSLIRFPAQPEGPQWGHSWDRNDYDPFVSLSTWVRSNSYTPFMRVNQVGLTPNMTGLDIRAQAYAEDKSSDVFVHIDGRTIYNMGKATHPSGAPNNALLATYAHGSGTVAGEAMTDSSHGGYIGRDGGIWLFPLEPQSKRKIKHIADDAVVVVDSPLYHEIMPRAVVPYWKIYGRLGPDIKVEQKNNGSEDPRLKEGEPFALSGASSLIDRETAGLNGIPWNTVPEGGAMAGRNYSNLMTQGADLAIYSDSEIYGIRVLLPIPVFPQTPPREKAPFYNATLNELQMHQLRILGEFPVREINAQYDLGKDEQNNPDTSFIVKIPAETPFVFQAIDKYGMGLNIENTPRSMVAGEKQTCIGCHVHTRDGISPAKAPAIKLGAFPFADFSKESAPLFKNIDTATGNVIMEYAKNIYPDNDRAQTRRSFAVDFLHDIGPIFKKRCASCHSADGSSTYLRTKLRLDDQRETFQLLAEDGYRVPYVGSDGKTYYNFITGSDITPHRGGCCLTSRWHSRLSARSSMLVWALYGRRLDGRNPATGMPFPDSGVLTDITTRDPMAPGEPKDSADTWPTVGEHLAKIASMPEEEKRLIVRWIDTGGAYDYTDDDFMRPVITVTPKAMGSGASAHVTKMLIGLWDDSPLDYSSFKVMANDVEITPAVDAAARPSVVTVNLPEAITVDNASRWHFKVEIQDRPGQTFTSTTKSEKRNRQVKEFDGHVLLKKAGLELK